VIEFEGLADHIRVGGKVTLPESVAEDDDGLRTLSLGCVGRLQSAAALGRDAEKIPSVRTKPDGIHVFVKFVARHGHGPVVHRHKAVHRRRLAKLADFAVHSG
jgi:hypothetical protein